MGGHRGMTMKYPHQLLRRSHRGISYRDGKRQQGEILHYKVQGNGWYCVYGHYDSLCLSFSFHSLAELIPFGLHPRVLGEPIWSYEAVWDIAFSRRRIKLPRQNVPRWT